MSLILLILTPNSDLCGNSWYKQGIAVFASCSFNAWIPDLEKKKTFVRPFMILFWFLFLQNYIMTLKSALIDVCDQGSI